MWSCWEDLPENINKTTDCMEDSWSKNVTLQVTLRETEKCRVLHVTDVKECDATTGRVEETKGQVRQGGKEHLCCGDKV